MARKNSAGIVVISQASLPMRGYSLSDSDWRYSALENISKLNAVVEGYEEEMAAANDVYMSDYDYDTLESKLNRATKELMSVWYGRVFPVLGVWWLKGNEEDRAGVIF